MFEDEGRPGRRGGVGVLLVVFLVVDLLVVKVHTLAGRENCGMDEMNDLFDSTNRHGEKKQRGIPSAREHSPASLN